MTARAGAKSGTFKTVTHARLACLLAATSLALAGSAVAQAAPDAPDAQKPAETPIETAIPVPVPSPAGFLLAWKPMILTYRLDTGQGSKFGSDNFQPLRGLARYTVMAREGTPFFGRFEIEGGEFQTDQKNQFFGSNGYDFAGRVVGGAATRLSAGVLFIASLGVISRYTHGAANGGAPTIGIFGALANAEIEWRIYPIITVSFSGEAAVAPLPYGADKNLGDLSDASEIRGRIQVSIDLARQTSLELGYDFTRWHSTFVNSTILDNPGPGQALVLEAREYAFTLGFRVRL